MSDESFSHVCIIFVLICGCFLFWLFSPNWLWNPNRPAESRYYYDVKRVFDVTERQSYDDRPGYKTVLVTPGDCPDLASMAKKAMSDSQLTIREVHDLSVKANQLYSVALDIELKNAALEATGQKPIVQTINCPRGSELFRE